MTGSSPPAQHCPSARELDDVELVLAGALPQVRWRPGTPAAPFDVVDPEGFAVARVEADGGLVALGAPAYGPFRRLRRTPAQVREAYAGATFAVVSGPVAPGARLPEGAERPVVLALAGTERVDVVRSALALADGRAPVVVVPFTPAEDDDAGLRDAVVRAYAGPDAVVEVPVAEAGAGSGGLVVLFTGLSGSGKSTVARGVVDHLLEAGRTVTTLDGDVVRRHLSAGLGFSPADRETNVARIGWVAAEIARHGGTVVASPIAPYDGTRRQVRAWVEAAGARFVLVHVATPVEECERRDRKGLYARARAGEIPNFTGISAPYEEPADAELRLDTTGRTVEDCVAEVVALLGVAGSTS